MTKKEIKEIEKVTKKFPKAKYLLILIASLLLSVLIYSAVLCFFNK